MQSATARITLNCERGTAKGLAQPVCFFLLCRGFREQTIYLCQSLKVFESDVVAFDCSQQTFFCIEQQVPIFPGIAVYGDVCRDDLLFELEPTAVLER